MLYWKNALLVSSFGRYSLAPQLLLLNEQAVKQIHYMLYTYKHNPQTTNRELCTIY
ncbi:MAG: hypothetical protein OFPI_17760 [Osedax symbiont Rs2]|nr:MAG: hypothetical protein OFPI_17760 [Osedax symbiont Rs2]